MICYRDMTFCPFWRDCAKGETCPRALTDEVRESARKWLGKDHSPISQYVSEPHCFVGKDA
jgi:hypothetical protein